MSKISQQRCSTLVHLEWTLDYNWEQLTGGRKLQEGWLERATAWREGRVCSPAWKMAMTHVRPPSWHSLQSAHREQTLNPEFRVTAACCRHRYYGSYPDLENQTTRKLNKDGASALHPVAKAIRGYLDLNHIHPFNDGNARASCIWLVWSLVSQGYNVPELDSLIRVPIPPGNDKVPLILAKLLS